MVYKVHTGQNSRYPPSNHLAGAWVTISRVISTGGWHGGYDLEIGHF